MQTDVKDLLKTKALKASDVILEILNKPVVIINRMRIPISAKLLTAIAFLIVATVVVLSGIFLTGQRTQLYRQSLQVGKTSLGYVATNAGSPLLNQDVLGLSRLVTEAAETDGISYAFVTNKEGVIQASSNVSQLGKSISWPEARSKLVEDDRVTSFTYTLQDEEQKTEAEILNVSKPVTLINTELGEAHVGLSLSFIADQIWEVQKTILIVGVIIVLFGGGLTFLLARYFSTPIGALQMAAQEIGSGNLSYKVNVHQNDELGDLADSFNYMGEELFKKQMVQDSFGKYVGSEVLDMILADPDGSMLKGSRKVAAVVFTDIRGFTAYSENRTPEEVVEALNAYFDIATRCIQKHNGYVDKFIGDAVMGIFGVPLPQDNPSKNAVLACLEMQEAFIEAAKGKPDSILDKVGIGINTGSLVAGNIGSQDKVEYTVIGDAVNIASRINSLAMATQVIITEDTYKEVSEMLEVEALPPQTVKGKVEPLTCYRIIPQSKK